MSAEFRLAAYAKINLTLDILGRRPDGYHELSTVMQSVSLCDRVTVRPGEGLHLVCRGATLPEGEKNTAYRAATLFFDAAGRVPAAEIELEKHIPQAAGLGGGSADAAAVLIGLNRLYGMPLGRETLLSLAERIGADVPFCLLGGTMLAEGIGERLTPLPPMPDCGILLLKPCDKPSTGELYRLADACPTLAHPSAARAADALAAGRLPLLAEVLGNSFEAAWRTPAIPAALAALRVAGVLGASLSGSGPTVFGLFETLSAAEAAAAHLRDSYPVCIAAAPAACGVGLL